MPRPERKIEMQHSFVSSFLIVEENQKSEPSPLSRKGSDFYYSVRITGLEPARRRHWTLKPARLPVPPSGHDKQTIETPVCNRFWCPGRDSNSQRLAAVASETTASAKIAPPGHRQQTIENPSVMGFGVPGGNRTRNALRHQPLKLACLPDFTTGTYWRC